MSFDRKLAYDAVEFDPVIMRDDMRTLRLSGGTHPCVHSSHRLNERFDEELLFDLRTCRSYTYQSSYQQSRIASSSSVSSSSSSTITPTASSSSSCEETKVSDMDREPNKHIEVPSPPVRSARGIQGSPCNCVGRFSRRRSKRMSESPFCCFCCLNKECDPKYYQWLLYPGTLEHICVFPEFVCSFALTSLDLDHNHLRTLPESIAQLSGTLHRLNLYDNELVSLPQQITQLTQLRTLILSYNQLSGKFPDISSLVHLRVLHLQGNQFHGALPDLGTLTCLERLNLCHNRFTVLPLSIGFLPRLHDVRLNGNRLALIPGSLHVLLSPTKSACVGIFPNLFWSHPRLFRFPNDPDETMCDWCFIMPRWADVRPETQEVAQCLSNFFIPELAMIIAGYYVPTMKELSTACVAADLFTQPLDGPLYSLTTSDNYIDSFTEKSRKRARSDSDSENFSANDNGDSGLRRRRDNIGLRYGCRPSIQHSDHVRPSRAFQGNRNQLNPTKHYCGACGWEIDNVEWLVVRYAFVPSFAPFAWPLCSPSCDSLTNAYHWQAHTTLTGTILAAFNI